MADVVLIKEDLFKRARVVAEEATQPEGGLPPQTQKAVRRPLDGFQFKEDKYAVIRVYTATGTESRDLHNSSAPELKVGYTSNLLIQNVQETRQEKSQIVQTFGEDFVYFFGERPTQVQFSAQLLDTSDFQWHQEWWMNYSNALRGTKLVDKNSRVYLEIDDVMFEGYILTATTSRVADDHHRVTLSFSMLVTNKMYLSELRNSYLPPASLTQDQIQAISNGESSGASQAQLNQVSELNDAVAAVTQASKGPPQLSRNGAVSVQTAVVPGSTVQSTADYLKSVYARLVEYSEKPYYETRAGAEYPNRSAVGRDGTQAGTSSAPPTLKTTDAANKEALKDFLSPDSIDQARQSKPVDPQTVGVSSPKRGPLDEGTLDPMFSGGIFAPRGVFTTNVSEVPNFTNNTPPTLSSPPIADAAVGEKSSAGANLSEGTIIVDFSEGTLLDQIMNGVQPVAPFTIEVEDESLPATPSGGQVGYDPVLNAVPIQQGESALLVAGAEVLRGVDPPTYIGEYSRRVNIPTVLE